MTLSLHRGLPRWQLTTLRQRLKLVRELRYLLVDRRTAICDAIAADVQRTPSEVISNELLPTAAALEYLEKQAAQILKCRQINNSPGWLMGVRATVHRHPFGVVGVLGTWNYPLFLNAVPMVQALVAGNAVLWKPSEHSPKFAEVWTKLLRDAGFGESVLQVLPATREAGEELIEADVDFVHFTGSEAVGRKIAARLGERLIPSVLELSGNDALFVLADADVKLAARSAWYGSTLNRGRTCMATRRAFVHESVANRFRTELLAVQSAYGEDFPSTVVFDLPMNEAGFDPTLAVRVFRTLDEARVMHAESPHRLTASVFTDDLDVGWPWARSLGVGTVTFNDVIAPTAHPATPFPAAGASGWGETQGAEGLLAFTRPQVVTTRRGRFRPHIDTVLDADPAGDDIVAGILLTRHSRTWGGMWKGLGQMFRGFRQFGRQTPPKQIPPRASK